MDYLARIPIPAPTDMNSGLTSPGQDFMIAKVGDPRNGNYTANCQPPTNPAFIAQLWEGPIGPFSVRGHHLFLRALRDGFDEIRLDHPDLIPLIHNMGCLCCRWVRRAPGAISNHSFGCANDIAVGSLLPPLGSTWWTVGHSIIYSVMHKRQIFSGAGYKVRKDPMHFEASRELISTW